MTLLLSAAAMRVIADGREGRQSAGAAARTAQPPRAGRARLAMVARARTSLDRHVTYIATRVHCQGHLVRRPAMWSLLVTAQRAREPPYGRSEFDRRSF